MIRKIFQRFLMARRFWRYVGFDQLGELYTSMTLRSVGLSLVGVFVPIYLYMSGYDLVAVALFMAGVFGVRVVADVASGFMVAKIGPKHSIFYSYLLQIIVLYLLLTVEVYSWPLWLIAVSWGLSLSMFFISYHVNFSKIMRPKKGGQELGLMTILERFGAALGPLIGGGIATVFGAEYTIIAAIILFVGASIPLFMSSEPVKVNQKITFRGLPYRKLKRDLVSFNGLGFENTVAVGIWPLYIALFIVSEGAYASVGLVTSIGIVAAILAAKAVGMLVDRKHGKQLLQISVVGLALTHLFRPFIGSLGGASLVNAVNDAAGTGSRLPYTKGMYDRADRLPGYRIVYLVTLEVFGDLGKAMAWTILALLLLAIDSKEAFWLTFVAGAFFALLILLQRYPVLIESRESWLGRLAWWAHHHTAEVKAD